MELVIGFALLLTAVPAGGSAGFVLGMLLRMATHGHEEGTQGWEWLCGLICAGALNAIYWLIVRQLRRTTKETIVGYSATFWNVLLITSSSRSASSSATTPRRLETYARLKPRRACRKDHLVWGALRVR